MQARYYDPVIGRFYLNDPLPFRGIHSFNRYAYGNNNPYKYIYPTDMCANRQDEAGAGGCSEGMNEIPFPAEYTEIIDEYVDVNGNKLNTKATINCDKECMQAGDLINKGYLELRKNFLLSQELPAIYSASVLGGGIIIEAGVPLYGVYSTLPNEVKGEVKALIFDVMIQFADPQGIGNNGKLDGRRIDNPGKYEISISHKWKKRGK
ncbi:RHS repeat-associated core domain-containing protein [Pseudoalteromonas piscicida]|uniref:RHS repeat domain-containing protein n=1 Tax=Pseudoalteromonas piscicida TaxID=43662 RepID=UPI0030B44F6A